MTIHQSLPFVIGNPAEAKSFQVGYRGAWFRCKIQDIRRKKGQIVYALEYYDYPGEKIKWTRIYQKLIRSSSLKEVKRELMVRPHFPLIYHESELPHVATISEVVVVVDGIWRVGDLVDWSYEGCFWSGTITEVVNDDIVQIKLPEPPIGEGKIYEARCEDLRPSLDWFPEIGWTVTKPLENGRSCPRLIQPVKQVAAGPLPRSLVGGAEDGIQDIRATPNSLLEFNESASSHTSTCSLPLLSKSMRSKESVKGDLNVSEKDMLLKHGAHVETGVSTVGRPSCSDGISATYVRDVPNEARGANSAEDQHNRNASAKKIRVNETIALNSTASDSIESTIMDLEELVNRVKWLRQILKSGIPSNSGGPTWKCMEQSKVSTPK